MKSYGVLMVLAIAACDGSGPAAEGTAGSAGRGGAGGGSDAGAPGGRGGGSIAGAGGSTGTAGAAAGVSGTAGRGGAGGGVQYPECSRPNAAASCGAMKSGMWCGVCSHVNCIVTDGFDGNNVSRGLPPDLCVASCSECQ